MPHWDFLRRVLQPCLLAHVRYRPNLGRFADIGSRKKCGIAVGTPFSPRAGAHVRGLLFQKCPMCPRCGKTPDQTLETVGHLQNPRCKPFRKTPDQKQVACDSFWEEGLCTKGIDRGTNGGFAFCRGRAGARSGDTGGRCKTLCWGVSTAMEAVLEPACAACRVRRCCRWGSSRRALVPRRCASWWSRSWTRSSAGAAVLR